MCETKGSSYIPGPGDVLGSLVGAAVDGVAGLIKSTPAAPEASSGFTFPVLPAAAVLGGLAVVGWAVADVAVVVVTLVLVLAVAVAVAVLARCSVRLLGRLVVPVGRERLRPVSPVAPEPQEPAEARAWQCPVPAVPRPPSPVIASGDGLYVLDPEYADA